MKAAKGTGTITSFDLSFREKMWKIHGDNERAVETISTIVENVGQVRALAQGGSAPIQS